MAHYAVSVRTPLSADEAFVYMANLNNFVEWDPGVVEVKQIKGNGAGANGVFDVTVKAFPKNIVLQYRTTEFDPPKTVVALAESKALTSLDTITVTPDGDYAIVTYDAVLTLNGPLKLAAPVLSLMFQRIGNRAAEGLVRVLKGSRV